MNITEIKNDLLGKEMSFIELDNYMINAGFYSVFDDGAITNIKEDESVVYTSTRTFAAEIFINFEVTKDCTTEENPGAFSFIVDKLTLF